jgi:flagellar biosynthesis/type III secretory pathway M-ring protein FliF/YscJ
VPVLSGKGLVSSEKLREEQYQAGAGGPGGAASGNAGVQPNVGLGTSGGGGGRNGSYVNKDETRQYEYSRNTSSVVKAPGKIKNLTVAAIIDETLTADAEDKVKQVLTAAAGLNSQRGDVVTVQRMKIQAAEAAKTEQTQMAAAEKSQRTESMLHLLLRGGLSVAAAVMILISVVVAMRQFKESSASLPPMARQQQAQAYDPSGGAAATSWTQPQAHPGPQAQSHQPAQGHSQGHPQPMAPPVAEPAGPELSAVREQLRRIASDDTEAVADRIQSLLQNVGN